MRIEKRIIVIFITLFIGGMLLNGINNSIADDDGSNIWYHIHDQGYNEYGCRIIADDLSGDLYVSIYNSSGQRVILTKYSPAGTNVFNKTSSFKDVIGQCLDLKFDSLGNIFLTSSYQESPGNYDVFLVKFDNDGNEKWNKTWNSAALLDVGVSLELDSQDNIFILGFNVSDTYLIKYNNTGTLEWAKRVNGLSSLGGDLAIDPSGNIYVLNANGTTPNFDLYLTKYDKDGVEVWNKTWDGFNSIDLGYEICLDSYNNIYITGLTNKSASDLYEILLLKYDSNGNYQWSKTWGYNSYDIGYALEIDSSGYLYVCGQANDTHNKMALLKYNPDGLLLSHFIWEPFDKANISCSARSLAIDASGNIYLIGTISNETSDTHDMIIAKFEISNGKNPTNLEFIFLLVFMIGSVIGGGIYAYLRRTNRIGKGKVRKSAWSERFLVPQDIKNLGAFRNREITIKEILRELQEKDLSPSIFKDLNFFEGTELTVISDDILEKVDQIEGLNNDEKIEVIIDLFLLKPNERAEILDRTLNLSYKEKIFEKEGGSV